jgi:hypothetical protein
MWPDDYDPSDVVGEHCYLFRKDYESFQDFYNDIIQKEDKMKDHEEKSNHRDDIKRWLPKGTNVEEVKFGDQKGFNEAFLPPKKNSIPEWHRRDEPVHPNYYKGDNKDGKAIEVFDIIDQFVNGDFYLGNVLKYVCRAGKKSKETKKQDLEKALHYIMEAIKRCGNSEEDEKC